MKILVVGSGGREHALVWKFKQSSHVKEVFCANGNAGIAEIAECVNIKPDEISRLVGFAEENKIDLTFVGGETSLALGIVDEFEKRGLKIVGVSKEAARLEASKAFAKDFMARNNIPTAMYKTAKSAPDAKSILESGVFGDENSPVVIKADGLAAGKGVVVSENRKEALKAISELEDLVGKAAEKIVLEECLFGREISLLLFTDGKNFAVMPPVKDHKRIGENDTGANTGGMGTISDASLLSTNEIETILETIVKPTLKGAEKEGFPYCGILFLGLMMTEKGAKLLEYNVRLGDPETQVVFVQLKTDLVEICSAILQQNLSQTNIEWHDGNSACVVLAAENYPGKPRTGDVINGLEKAKSIENINVFHAGTASDNEGNLITVGGRVLSVTANGKNLTETLQKAYRAVDEIHWNGMQFRRDIGK